MITQNHNRSEIDNNNTIKTLSYTPKACGRCGEPPADCWCPEGFLDD